MVWFVGKVLLAALVISFSSWLADKKPALAGFLISLPMATLLTLLFNYGEFKDLEKTATFAKSIFVSIPLTLMFFLPFLLQSKLRLGFWGLYSMGIGLLIAAYFAHQYILKRWG